LRCRPDPELSVRKPGVREVLPGYVVESLGTLAGAHAVDLHDHEAQFGQGVLSGQSAEFLRHKGSLRSGVNFLDHRVAGLRIEV
jgi:hypothetical protein